MKQHIFSNFPPITKAEWQKYVRKANRTDPETLLWKTTEGFQADPYHDRGSTKNRRDPLFWHEEVKLLRPVDMAPDNKDNAANRLQRIVDTGSIPLLNAGIRYNFEASQWESSGFPVTDPLELREWLKDANALNTQVFIDFGAAAPIYHSIFSGSDGKLKDITLLYDPFTGFLDAESGALDFGTVKKLLPELVRRGGHPLCVDGSFYAQAGASVVEQAAFVTAVLAEILVNLPHEERKNAAAGMLVRTTSGPLYFPEMAKLRAIRILWANLLKAFRLKNIPELDMISETSSLLKTGNDAENNLIRNTVEAISSVAGGANYLLIHPHNELFEEENTFNRRMADNLFHILKEEAFADAVSDPAAGSFYIENLTDTIADEAWTLFQEIEAEGGFMEAIKSGMIQQRINASAEEKKQIIVSGERKLVGVNIFKSGSSGDNPQHFQRTFQKLETGNQAFGFDMSESLLSQWSDALLQGVHLGDLLSSMPFMSDSGVEPVPRLKPGIVSEGEKMEARGDA